MYSNVVSGGKSITVTNVRTITETAKMFTFDAKVDYWRW